MIGALAGAPSPGVETTLTSTPMGEPPCPNMRKPPYARRLVAEARVVVRPCDSSCLRLNLLGGVVLEADGRDEVQLCLQPLDVFLALDD
jgi:hypothetical protein